MKYMELSTAERVLQLKFEGADWVSIRGAFGDDQIGWKCRTCGRKEKHPIDILGMQWFDSPQVVLHRIAHTFVDHRCLEDLKQAVLILLGLLETATKALAHSADDSTKRFALLEFK